MAIGYEGYKGYGSPEQIAKTRALIDALMTKNRPMTTGDGLVALGDGIVANVLNRRAEESEKAGMADWENTWSSLLSGGDLLGSTATSGVAGELAATSPAVTSGEPIDLTGNEVFSGFIDTVREGGVTNPYALAAIAATGKAESGFSPGNVNRTWADPSESGQPGTAGGIMSWRGPRYQALAATGDLSPQGQARFFLQEDPNLIAALNNAGSVEEAQSLMNNAWRFAGYDRPGGEAARRLSLANSFLPTFQGQGEVAALTPEAAIEAVAPGSGSVVPQEPQFDAGRFGDPINLAEMPPNAAQLPGSLVEQGANYAPPLPPPTTVESRPVASVAESLVQPPVEVAQAGGADYFPPAPTAPSQGGRPSVAQLLAAANHPFAPKAAQGVIGALLEQEMKRNDPMTQLQLEKAQLELDAMRQPQRQSLINAGDGRLYNPNTGEWVVAPNSGEKVPDAVRALEMRAERAGLQPGTPEYNEFMINGGRGGMSLQVGPDGQVTFQQGGSAKPLTESQSKLTLFQSLQTETQPVLLDLESQFNPANLNDAAARSTPIAGNFFKSEQGQIYDSAATAWAEGALRIATGAAATPEEMERTKRAYFAQPGDTPNTIAFKAQMREMYNRSIDRSLSKEAPGTLPKPSDFATRFDDDQQPTKGGRRRTTSGVEWSID